jgi:hypothetical protein
LIYGSCRHKQELEGKNYAPIKYKYLQRMCALKKCKIPSYNMSAAPIPINKITVIYSILTLKLGEAAKIQML